MGRTKIGGNRILIILLLLAMCMSPSACTVENEPESSIPAPSVSDEHSESDSSNTKTVTELTLEDIPTLVPDVLGLREKEYEDVPFLETQEQLSEYVLWNLLCGRTEMECRLSRNLSDNMGMNVLVQACGEAMSYYLFSSYKPWDMYLEDDGDPDSIYSKIKLVYDVPAFDQEAKMGAWSYIVKNPPPEGGFSDYDEEREYARKIHDYVACKVTYDPIGYETDIPTGETRYDTFQEAYNVLGEGQETAVCAGYARAFALICHYAGINCAWVRGNETEESSHAWNVIYPCDGSEPVLVDVTWDDGLSLDIVGQTDVDSSYFYIPLSSDYEHEADENMANFIQYINEAARD